MAYVHMTMFQLQQLSYIFIGKTPAYITDLLQPVLQSAFGHKVVLSTDAVDCLTYFSVKCYDFVVLHFVCSKIIG